MIFPVVKATLPSDLKGVENGQVPSKLLRTAKPGKLHHLAAQAWLAMVAEAKRDGIILTTIGTYRSYAAQEQMFLERYAPRPTLRKPKVTRVWKGKKYWLKRGKSPSAAPGTSGHGYGVCVDAAQKVKGKTVGLWAAPNGKSTHKNAVGWLLDHAVSFGFCWDVADMDDPNFEVWHLRYYAGDAVPTRVQKTLSA